MSLIVKVFINKDEIINLSARRLEDLKDRNEVHNYVTQNGDIIEHNYADGAGKLAIKLLEMYNA